MNYKKRKSLLEETELAVNEGVLKFVAEKNGIAGDSHEEVMASINSGKIMSEDAVAASERIWGSFRNDVHHMNPKVTDVPFRDIAKRNLCDLALIEKEIFAVGVHDGKLVPKQPRYWDIQEDGTVGVFLRLGP